MNRKQAVAGLLLMADRLDNNEPLTWEDRMLLAWLLARFERKDWAAQGFGSMHR